MLLLWGGILGRKVGEALLDNKLSKMYDRIEHLKEFGEREFDRANKVIKRYKEDISILEEAQRNAHNKVIAGTSSPELLEHLRLAASEVYPKEIDILKKKLASEPNPIIDKAWAIDDRLVSLRKDFNKIVKDSAKVKRN